MPRYWVSLGMGSSLDPDVISPNMKQEEECYDELEKLATHHSSTDMSFVTLDLGEAIEVANKAVIINKKYFGMDKDDETGVSITQQPECPKCVEWGRFRDKFCGKCGTELVVVVVAKLNWSHPSKRKNETK